ncbi:MAG: 50S ribosome-binding GTPase [Lachnospiraceae bacterium]|nr:50S ribosome-binding GTPase [Lachnospiraceae bacterium]
MTTLKDVRIGDTVKVKKLTGEGAVKRRIMDMGITKGVTIKVIKVAPLGDPMEITVRGYELSVRKADAEMIIVEAPETEASETAEEKADKTRKRKKNMEKDKEIRIALAGNPNSGKTTLFNALTGANQFVGNWPGVTVEKKEGRLKKHSDVKIVDLPGIYSLSPYTLEEVVARNFLIDERPDAILNIVDGTNLERNLYLTTQLAELGIPMVIAVNMMDVVRKNGDSIDIDKLSKAFNCRIIEISALKGENTLRAAEAALEAAAEGRHIPRHEFSGPVEHALAHIEEACLHDSDETTQRW